LGPEDSIDKILLAGEEAESAQRELHETLPDCELIGSRIQLDMPVENRHRLQEAAVSLGLAYSGLVHRPPVKLNLLPQELRIRQTKWAYIPTVLLGLAILAALGGLAFRQVFQQRILLRKLDAEILALKGRVSRVQAIRSEAETLEGRLRYIEGMVRQRDLNLEVLRELTTILPSDTFLNVYINKEGSIQLSGSSSAAPDLIPKLEGSPLLQNVIQRGTMFKDAQTGKDRFNFDAKLERKP
jgi:Tfp pilus assembly protein PilN